MVNYACDFNQSPETGKYFEGIINMFIFVVRDGIQFGFM